MFVPFSLKKQLQKIIFFQYLIFFFVFKYPKIVTVFKLLTQYSLTIPLVTCI